MSEPCWASSVFIPGYTLSVKTAISLPDQTYERATRRARSLGISRSEFFARAAERYADELEAASVTEQINAAIDDGPMDESNAWAVEAGRRHLRSTVGRDDADW